MPDGRFPSGLKDKATYNIILYLFHCEEHKRIAVTDVKRTGVVWLPFVAIDETFTWELASEKGLEEFFDKGQVDTVDGGVSESARKMPKYKMNICQVLRVQMPDDHFQVRLTQFVRLYKTDG